MYPDWSNLSWGSAQSDPLYGNKVSKEDFSGKEHNNFSEIIVFLTVQEFLAAWIPPAY